MANHLSSEKSPYLLQHKDNPVDWYPWGEEALNRAREENKPIFLSVGYSTCHWCHVMAHESFEDAQVAEILNRNYIPIKVDREERPDIDAVYMNVCQAMTGSGGWPLTVILSPDQLPIYAGTYFPKYSSYSRIGLLDILNQIAPMWKTTPEKLTENGNKIVDYLNRVSASRKGEPRPELLDKTYEMLKKNFSAQWGGFSTAPKFPTPHHLLFLMQYSESHPGSDAMHMVEQTLDAMARGGLFDHIGGGFSRYSTDEKWLRPHFEKMLYDNALLLMAYTEAYQRTGKEEYADIARRTADYVLREMTSREGGYFSAQDADSDGVEGKYYLLSGLQILQVLGEDDGHEFCRRYGIDPGSKFPEIPNRIGIEEASWKKDDPRLQQLYAYRRDRTVLHCDDKTLLSWNCWMIMAMIQAGMVLEEPSYSESALRAMEFLSSHMISKNDRLCLRYRDGDASYDGQLEDYALFALAGLSLYRWTGDSSYLQQALHRARQMIELFEDPAGGGYYRSAEDGETLIMRTKELNDGAMPAGNSCAAMVLAQLSLLTGESFWSDATRRQLTSIAGSAEKFPIGFTYAMLAMDQMLSSHQELVCCTRGMPTEHLDYLKKTPARNLSILIKDPAGEAVLNSAAPFTAAYAIPESGTCWYLCENGSCRLPSDTFPLTKKDD